MTMLAMMEVTKSRMLLCGRVGSRWIQRLGVFFLLNLQHKVSLARLRDKVTTITAVIHACVIPDGHGLVVHGVLELVVGSEGDESAPGDAQREEHLLGGIAPHRPV